MTLSYSIQVDRLNGGFKSESVGEIINQTAKVTDEEELYAKDVQDVVYILDQTKDKTQTQDERRNFIKSSSNIVDQTNEQSWKQIDVRIYFKLVDFYIFLVRCIFM